MAFAFNNPVLAQQFKEAQDATIANSEAPEDMGVGVPGPGRRPKKAAKKAAAEAASEGELADEAASDDPTPPLLDKLKQSAAGSDPDALDTKYQDDKEGYDPTDWSDATSAEAANEADDDTASPVNVTTAPVAGAGGTITGSAAVSMPATNTIQASVSGLSPASPFSGAAVIAKAQQRAAVESSEPAVPAPGG